MLVDHLLEDKILTSVKIFQVCGHRIRHGHYSSISKLLWADSVATSWHAIAKTHLLEGLRNPRKPRVSHAKYLDKRLTRTLCHVLYQDMPPKWGKYTLLGLFMAVEEAANISCPFAQCQADLIQTVIFFYLQLCTTPYQGLAILQCRRGISHEAPTKTLL